MLMRWNYKEYFSFDTATLWQQMTWLWGLNPLRATFFREDINIYLHFVSYLHIDTTQVVEILSQIRQEPTYSTYICYLN